MQLIYREKINNNILANNAFILKKYSLYISIIIFTVIEYVIKCNYIISFIFVYTKIICAQDDSETYTHTQKINNEEVV